MPFDTWHMTLHGTRRKIVNGEALAWLSENPASAGTSVITSLPDVSELPALGFEGWRAWFVEAARRVLRFTPDDGVAIFLQSDIRHAGLWIDKGHLVHAAADAEGWLLLWHRIVCRSPPGTLTQGRASYSHLLSFGRTVRPPRRPAADILPETGAKSFSKAMGETICRVACEYLREETSTHLVVDPFCGQGSVLKMANAFGFDALGVDLCKKRCRAALLGVLPQ